MRNPDYAYTPGKADQIDFRFYADDNALWADLQANNLDVDHHLPPDRTLQAAAVLGDRYINEPGMSFSYEAYPTQVDDFKNRDVRVALAKAVDWAEINEKLYFGTRTVATSFGRRPSPAAARTSAAPTAPIDPAAAKALLEARAASRGTRSSMAGLSNSENLAPKAECNMIQENLGVECEVKLFESFGEQLDAFNEARAPTTRASSSASAGMRTTRRWPTSSRPLFGTGAGSNYTGYSNPEFDKLIAEGNQAADEATAIAKWQEAEKVMYEEFPGHATQWRNNIGGYSNNVSNVKVNPGGYINIAEITVNSAG